jgi:hypothetical protein
MGSNCGWGIFWNSQKREYLCNMNKAVENKREQKKVLGKFFYDLGKLTFAALVLGGLLTYFQSTELNIFVVMMFLSGITITMVFAIIGDNLNK